MAIRPIICAAIAACISVQSMEQPRKKAVFILGAPRSGTSVTTGILGKLGLELGGKFTAGGSWNPKGDFEDEATVELNRKLIRSLAICPRNAVAQSPINWHSDSRCERAKEQIKQTLISSFNNAPVFGLKHPRVCLMLPLYLRAAEELGYEPNLIIVSRDPKDVVRSLNKSEKQHGDEYTMREGIEFVHQFLRPIGRYAGDYPHVRVTFNEITQQTPKAINKIRNLLPELDTFEMQKDSLSEFVNQPKRA